MLAGCPDEPTEEAFQDESKTANVVDSLVLALSKPEGLGVSDDEAKWEGKATHEQCVDKLSSKGVWQKRLLSIEKGIITWRSAKKCESGVLGRVQNMFGHSKSFAMQFLTAPSDLDADLVKLFEGSVGDA